MSAVPPYDPDAPGPATYVYARVADHIAARILAGELVPGMRLPGERDLAAEYGVALGTARRAIEELRGRRLVVTLAAKGTYVARPEDIDPPTG
ncbi:winged helix-turn-helix transcriptional regulator [Herbidospora galbida]|uniref:Winged helix-turn-helix transcriptional regulator n=1 Tax=Herbidospora galbida TaxID=2575442 RepID=A0A4U3MG24_9ACTN|nr:winged helix-turn-helix domain-containing protein [Herbidospora galbida]TKK88131.1 winged helix-turn-helix transcriptional regulator [Herbidospora galbida]